MKCLKTLHLTSKTNRNGRIKTKIFSAVAVVLFMSSSLNANSNVKQAAYYGKATDCAREARASVLLTAAIVGQDPNGENFQGWLNYYFFLYEYCLDN